MKHYFLIGILFVFASCLSEKKQVIQSTMQQVRETSKKEVKEKELKKMIKIIDTLPPKKISRTLEEYKSNLNIFSKKKTNNELITIRNVENITPISQEEFSFYYSLTYSDESNQALHDAITTKVLDNAIEDNGMVFFLYLNMSQFVDGEYAEGYYTYIETVVSNNKNKFCVMYKYLSDRSKWLFEPLYKEVCKGIKRTEEDY